MTTLAIALVIITFFAFAYLLVFALCRAAHDADERVKGMK